MPRVSRRKSRNGIYHIMLRGINRQTIFEDDEDRLKMLDTLKRFKKVSGIEVYSYCLMDNHIHLLMREVDETISKFIQRLSSSYVYWYNNKYERFGHLFQDRFKSENVDTLVYFLKVIRYIHQNPVKAGLANNVFDCSWTSINEYLGSSSIVDIDLPLHYFSPERKKALQLFSEFMQAPIDDECGLNDEVKIKVSDNELRIMMDHLGIPNASELQQMDKGKRNAFIRHLKQLEGVSIRQISRVTGISKSVIGRIG
ncbi:transposase [Virgibacillus ihumii]|uniref:transposase n=1 Tax=Virgibacillus ihumii TaxID=2686091 RepID=UPI00157D849E|nr:transposase [Virgibacillus ihumii]